MRHFLGSPLALDIVSFHAPGLNCGHRRPLASLRTRVELKVEILALRHPLAVFQQTPRTQLRLSRADRLLWVLLSRCWPSWRQADLSARTFCTLLRELVTPTAAGRAAGTLGEE
jgi:hypothetical protein